jgi:hypothetical protein
LTTAISLSANPVTLSLKVAVIGMGDVEVGLVAVEDSVTVGAAVSYVQVRLFEIILPLPAPSWATLAGMVTLTDPCPEGVTVKL